MNEIEVTGDGSHTLFVPDLQEHYHSTFGAITESEHVFIRHGLQAINKDPVTILEIGFGTGLNSFLTYIESQQNKKSIQYYAVEKYPLETEIIDSLNYPAILSRSGSDSDVFKQMHDSEWDKNITLATGFTLMKIKTDLKIFKPDFSYDLIFFDAFAPEKQPEMWTKEIFENLYDPLWPGGILVTYCAKGNIKRLLKQTGFQVEILAGPPGKRHMIRATKAG